jgi:hypothetical protein
MRKTSLSLSFFSELMERASTIYLYTSTPPLTCDESREKSSCGQDGNRRNRGRGELAATVTGKVNTWTQRGATAIFIINCENQDSNSRPWALIPC